ncbi:Roundabout -like protein 2 [Halotydeus destructor]|nr:Roundabout -like protein 2 [Halotydeus destructor]
MELRFCYQCLLFVMFNSLCSIELSKGILESEIVQRTGPSRGRPPLIVDDPTDVVLKNEGLPITLNCKAEGKPSPVIEWFKDGERLRHTGNRMVLPSGALFFPFVLPKKDTGIYWCEAKNDLGKVRSLNASVSLASAPKHARITEHPTDVVVKSNEAATLNCKAEGKPPPVIEWFKDGEKLRITDNRVVLPSGSLFFLHVRVSQELEDRDIGTYWCVARNEVGRAKSHSAVLRVAEAPTGSPLDVSVKVINETAALISWTEPARDTRDREQWSHFIVHVSDIYGHENFTASSKSSPVILDNLSSRLTYEIKVLAANSIGHGPASAPLYLRTDPAGDFASRSSEDEFSLVRSGNYELKELIKQPWVIIITALTMMFIMSSAVLIFLMRQITVGKKAMQVTYTTSIWSENDNDHEGRGVGGGLGGGCHEDMSTTAAHEGIWLDSKTWKPEHHVTGTTSSSKASTLMSKRTAHGYPNKLSYEYSAVVNESDLYEEVGVSRSVMTLNGSDKKENPSEVSHYAMTRII